MIFYISIRIKDGWDIKKTDFINEEYQKDEYIQENSENNFLYSLI